MSATAHSLFPASAAKRMLTCPASYALSFGSEAGARRASAFSAEGSLAHLIAEAKLFSGVPLSYFLGRDYTMDGHSFTVDQPMLDAVAVYTNYIETLMSLGYSVALEQRVNPGWIWQPDYPTRLDVELFGTADCIAWTDTELEVVDLKFGKGVLVEPEGNAQFLYYGAGALQHYHRPKVTLTVVQPRIPHPEGLVRSWPTTADVVMDWARDVLKPGVITAINDGGRTKHASEHCQFCPALAALTCDAPQQLTFDIARQKFLEAGEVDVPADPNALDPLHGIAKTLPQLPNDELAKLLFAGVVADQVLEAARDLAKQRIAAGQVIPGWMTTKRKGKRSWTAKPRELFEYLSGQGIDPALIADALTPSAVKALDPHLYEILESFSAEGTPATVLQPQTRAPRRAVPSLLNDLNDDAANAANAEV